MQNKFYSIILFIAMFFSLEIKAQSVHEFRSSLIQNDSYSTPYFEGFEHPTLFPPVGWSNYNVYGNVVWMRSYWFHSGAQSAICAFQNPGPGEDWLVTPRWFIQSGDSLVFWMRAFFSYGDPDSLLVYVSTTDSTIPSFTNCILYMNTSSYPPVPNWKRFAVSLNSFAGMGIFIAFKHFDDNGRGVLIDDVSIERYVTTISREVSINSDWNILSVPVNAIDMTGTVLFPTVQSNFYSYINGYQTVTTLLNGKGYWAKFNSAQNITITGTPVAVTTVPVVEGWNIIAPYHNPVSVSGITSTPPGIVSSNYYGYNNGYEVATALNFGKGYWVKVTQNGVLNLPTLLSKQQEQENKISELERFSKIIIEDNDGKKFKLYASNENIDCSKFELPPIPPAQIFDVRFSSDKYVENLIKPNVMKIQGAVYPIKIKVSGGTFRIKDIINGKFVDKILVENEELIIFNQMLNSFNVSFVGNVSKFELNQNYPNPFNPKTKISFTLDKDGWTLLKLYNSVGEEIKTIENKHLNSGKLYEYEIDCSNMSSGIYLIRLIQGNNYQIKKLVLMK